MLFVSSIQFRTVLMIGALASIIAGCAPQAPIPAPSGAPSQPATATGDCTTGKKGGTLVVGRAGDSVGFDPQADGNGESIVVINNIYSGLIRVEEDGQLVPDLATKWDISTDGAVYTFQIRKGVKFHDGSELDAASVKYTLERASLTDDPAYITEMRPSAGFTFAAIKSVDIVDPLTVKVTLKAPDTTFLNNMATPAAQIVSAAYVKAKGKDHRQAPVGTGPFKFSRWTRNQEIVLDKNPDYYFSGCPYLDRVIYRVIPDTAVRLQELRTGGVNIASGLGPTELPLVQSTPGLQVLNSKSPNIGVINFRLAKEPWNNVKVRQAVGYAINKQQLLTGLYGDLMAPAYGPLLPGLVGHDPQFRAYQYDVTKAKQLLSEAGYPNGFEIQLWIQAPARFFNPAGPRLAEALQAQLAAVGIKATVVSRDLAAYSAVINDKKNLEPDLYITGWLTDNGAQQYFIESYYASKGDYNTNGYANARVDKLLEDAARSTDPKAQSALYQEAQKLIVDDAPAMFLGNITETFAATATVQGYRVPPFGARGKYDRTWIETR